MEMGVDLGYFSCERLKNLKWLYSMHESKGSKDVFIEITQIRSRNRKPVLVLDRNIFSRLINIATKGEAQGNSTQDIAILIIWATINEIEMLPYFALNEYAEGTERENPAQEEYNIFDKIFTNIDIDIWKDLALGVVKKNNTLIKSDKDINSFEIKFKETSVDYLNNYAAMLKFSTILLQEKDQIKKFKQYFEWLYDTLKVSRYTEVYVIGVLLGYNMYTEPKKIRGKDLDSAIKGCQNQARDLSYLTQTSNDRWCIQYEPILVTDDTLLGELFSKGCFNNEPIREFEKNIKTSNKKISLWVDNLLQGHKEVQKEDYEHYSKEVVKKELENFKQVFNKKQKVT